MLPISTLSPLGTSSVFATESTARFTNSLRLDVDGRIIDLRISTLPTQYGESVVLRVLDKSIVRLDLTSLGMPSTVISAVREVVRRPNGIFVVTGPTGSGKTTTLYSALSEVNQVENKILTAEDPVEYELEGIMQLAVNPPIGLTFPVPSERS